MTPNISCRCLTQIALHIPRWRTKWRPCKAMTVSQAFILHFKCYSILHFAVCQHIRWAFLFFVQTWHASADCPRVIAYMPLRLPLHLASKKSVGLKRVGYKDQPWWNVSFYRICYTARRTPSPAEDVHDFRAAARLYIYRERRILLSSWCIDLDH